jgi:hypothetical protein
MGSLPRFLALGLDLGHDLNEGFWLGLIKREVGLTWCDFSLTMPLHMKLIISITRTLFWWKHPNVI